MKRSLLGLAIMASITAANAQPMLVKDINPGTNSSFPSHITAFGKKLVFSADDGTNGFELWSMDTSGTNIAFNINPANAAGVNYGAYRPMAILGKFIYFPGNNGTSGTELYRWDGTNPPALVADIVTTATVGSGIDEVVMMNGKIYFDANDGVSGEELWVFDTMTNMATRITDVYTGATGSSITNITIYNNKLYFGANSSTTGQELYSYDPATNSTAVVMDIEAGVGSSSPNNMVVINGKLYFTASTAANGRELYSYNGTVTSRLTDVVTGANSGINSTSTGVSMIIGQGNAIYFSGNESTTSTGHLYKYDPATGITTLVYKINPTGSSSISGLVNYGSKLVFSANNGTLGSELWWYKGAGIPTLLGDIRTGAVGSTPTDMTLLNGTLYFSAFDSSNGTELYKFFDSTAANITNVAFTGSINIFPNPAHATVTAKINLTEAATLGMKLVDMSGKVVYIAPAANYTSGTHQMNFPVENLATGTYLYTFFDNNGRTMVSGTLLKD